ncbi:hypothetical protein VNI00_000039 [Paramarasmius palmivorus]|uniref:F-box domain-containing protein n=1 Tax=Paramarasmius palmivorus TaxID=297713 RepID=A0AAW0EBV4_9AGAR
MHPTPLPFEILENIVENVAIHVPPFWSVEAHLSRQTISSCSLVSRSWLPAARQRFFLTGILPIPSREPRFNTLKTLCQSPLSTMHLTRIDRIACEPSNPNIQSFFKWFTSPSVALGNCDRIKEVFLLSCWVPPLEIYRVSDVVMDILVQRFSAVTCLRFCGVRFATCSQLIEFLGSFPQLVSLKCTEVYTEEAATGLVPGTRRSTSLGQIKSLQADYTAFVNVLYPHIVFPGLRDLVFTDNPKACKNLNEEEKLRRLKVIGDILEHTGQHLQNLSIECSIDVANNNASKSTIDKTFNLTKKAPLLQKLRLSAHKNILEQALAFQVSHPNVKDIDIVTSTPDSRR